MAHTDLKKAVLCYATPGWAFFTTQPLDKQWGDDWNDVPYEHNAGDPYAWREDNGKPWQILKVRWAGPYLLPCDGHSNSPWSVQAINRGEVPWLRAQIHGTVKAIYAGTTLEVFKKTVEAAGGQCVLNWGASTETEAAGKLYPPLQWDDETDPVCLWYSRHLAAMTDEGLHDKSDIAWQLAVRDARIEELVTFLDTAARTLFLAAGAAGALTNPEVSASLKAVAAELDQALEKR
jgi:hypothetical protein